MATALLKLTDVQLGSSVTATNNFTIYQPATPDGTVRIGNGNSGSATDIMTLNSSGNVGIGTSSPITRLQVSASNSASNVLFNGTTKGIRFGNSTTDSIIEGVDNTGVGSFQPLTIGGSTLYLSISGDTKVTLDSSGNLGLGVTPSAWGSGFKAFEIGRAGSGLFSVFTDSLQLTNNYYYNGTNYIYAASGYAERYHMVNGTHNWYTAPSGTAGNAISFTQAMTLDASGNLIVGGTSALVSASTRGNITVNGAANSILSFGIGGVARSYIFQSGTDFSVWNLDNAPMLFGTNNAERMRIASSGNVGIGATNPQQLLETRSSVASGSNAYNRVAATSFTGVDFGQEASVGNGIINVRDNADLRILTNNVDVVRAVSGGNFQFNSGYGSVATAYGCRAWVNFNGTGTVAIRASGNVSSITDVAVGTYNINFTNAMPDANYSAVTCATKGAGTESQANSAGVFYREDTVGTSSFQLFVMSFSGNLIDRNNVMSAIFR